LLAGIHTLPFNCDFHALSFILFPGKNFHQIAKKHNVFIFNNLLFNTRLFFLVSQAQQEGFILLTDISGIERFSSFLYPRPAAIFDVNQFQNKSLEFEHIGTFILTVL
jgi:hypothetical protein